MSDLTFSAWSLPTAELGTPSPLAPIQRRPRPAIEAPEELSGGMAYGHASFLLPYGMQDAYSRNLTPIAHPVAVLENRWLKAVFLLDLGGRLWSLHHKPSQTELLAPTPAITFCNLGLRNAWFRGGVEWNVGTTGHSPLTCSPVHAACLQDGQGNPILRMFEWERLRQVVVQIDVYLPDESQVLLVRPRILNPGEGTRPMYWWSNLAVPWSQGTRVLVPANEMYVLGRRGAGLQRCPVPISSGVEVTDPSNWPHAADLFFVLPPMDIPWIGAVTPRGMGIFHASQAKMSGRKLWVWGNSPAGRNWQELLAPGGGEYIELQAGLTQTQLEHLPLAAGESWSWVEAYGQLAVDPGLALGSSWESAWRHAADRIARLVTADQLSDVDRALGALEGAPPEAVAHRGTGWGALENRRRRMQGQTPLGTPGLVFSDQTLSGDQLPWATLLETGSFPLAPPDLPPRDFVVDAPWHAILEQSLIADGRGPWNAWLHLGIMRRYAGDDLGAEVAWRQSLAELWTPWTARSLAVLKREQGDSESAVEWMLNACQAAPEHLGLLIECGSMLLEAGRARQWLQLLDGVEPRLRAHGRIRLLEAQAAAMVGELECAERFFADRIVPDDLREGETSLEDLWSALQQRLHTSPMASAETGSPGYSEDARQPIPADLDYVIR